MHNRQKQTAELPLTPVDAQIYQEVREKERSLLDAATLELLDSSTTEERTDLALLDRIRRAGEIQLPFTSTGSAKEGNFTITSRNYTSLQQHLKQTEFWQALAPHLAQQGIELPGTDDFAVLYSFLFKEVYPSFPKESRNLYDKLSHVRSGIHLHFWLNLLPGRERDAYIDGRETMRETMHLSEDCVAHICTPISELIAQLEQSEAGEDI